MNLPISAKETAQSSAPRAWRAAARARWLSWELTAAVSCVALWMLARSYDGIVQDARIYIGRTLADLDPAGIGRDLMFARDGQMGFTLFPQLAGRLVAGLGPAGAGMLIAVTGLGLWLAALALMARHLARGRLLWAMLVFVAILPADYGAFGAFHYGEALAIPRPFAEASVLAALAALMARRPLPAALLLGVGSLLHPIMALPGIGILITLLCLEDRRRLLPLIVAGLGVAVVGALGLPLAGRLFVSLDPAWREILEARAPYLFPRLWPAAAWCGLLVQIATVAIAARGLSGRPQTTVLAAIFVALAGLATSLVLGDWAGSLLIVQMQPWRALWLVGVLGAALLPLAIAQRQRGEPIDQCTAALLAAAWLLTAPAPTLAAVSAGLALLADGRRGALVRVTRPVAQCAWTFAAIVGAATFVPAARGLLLLIASSPAPMAATFTPLWAFGTQTGPLGFAVMAWALAEGRPAARATLRWAVGLSALLLTVAILVWDARSPMQRAIENGETAGLPHMLAERPGEILWIDSDTEAWWLAQRPQWAGSIQGAAGVFSRQLALQWDERMRRLIALGLAIPEQRSPYTEASEAPPPAPAAAAREQFCRAADAPAWIIAPIENALTPPAGASLWHPPVHRYKVSVEHDSFVWRRIDSYAVYPCGAGGGSRE